MAPKYRDGDVIVSVSGKWISWTHTIVAYTAFLGALVTGLWLHYHKIVQNEYYVRKSSIISSSCLTIVQGYPQEWFPSVSATIGDRYPERSVFQLFIAITSGTRPSIYIQENPALTFTFRTALCSGLPLVHPHRSFGLRIAEDSRGNRTIPYNNMRWMDLHHING